MGREIKRVPLDFDQPIGEIWPGFLPPDDFDFPPCPSCSYDAPPTIMDQLFPQPKKLGSGETPEAYAISQTFYPHMIGGPMADRLAWHDKLGQAEVDMLIENGRLTRQWKLMDRVELQPPYEVDEYGHEIRVEFVRNDKPNPTAAEVNAAERAGHVHDAINRSYLVEFRCKQLGIEMNCPTCNGHGDIATDEQRAAYESWEGTEPPEGEGWQLWSTTTEGHPVSPVFATGDELAVWMSQNPCGFASSTPSLETAMQWVHGSGWAPSMVMVNGQFVDPMATGGETE